MEDLLMEEEFDGLLNLKEELDVDLLFKGSFLGDELGRFNVKLEQSEMDGQYTDFVSGEERQIGQKSKRNTSDSPMSLSSSHSALSTRDPTPSPLQLPNGSNSAFPFRPQATQPSSSSSSNLTLSSLSSPPPRQALSTDLIFLHRPCKSENEFMRVSEQPPLEIRTRTKNENRTFSCAVQILKSPFPDCSSATVELCYATDAETTISTLGGTLTKPIVDGLIHFDDLSVSVASPKHGEKEFMLRITLNSATKSTDVGKVSVYSTPFYAFSHKSVLKRRKEVSLRALSHTTVSGACSSSLHVVGMPFVRSDRLQCVFRVRKGDLDTNCLAAFLNEAGSQTAGTGEDNGWLSLRAPQLEVFSESVLFFQLPHAFFKSGTDLEAFVQVTNDGRNFSNPMPFVYIADAPPSPKRHCTIRSRM